MHQHAAHGRRHRDLLGARVVDAHGQHQPAEQRRRDIVDVHRPAGDGLAVHRELEQLELAERLLQQRIRRDHGRDRRGGRAAEAGTQRNAFLDRDLDPEGQRQRRGHGHQRHAGGVLLRLQRQVRLAAGDGRDPDPGLRHLPRLDAIAHCLDGVAEDVEANADVADRRGRESCNDAAAHVLSPAAVRSARPGRRPGAAGRRTRRPPSPPGRRQVPGRSVDSRHSVP